MRESNQGYRCPKCRKQTGFKHVPRGRNGMQIGDTTKRGSCRFCGYIPEENRMTPQES